MALVVVAAMAVRPPASAQPVQPPVRRGLVRRPTSADSTALAGVRSMLERSAIAWNRGDLDGFVSFYAPGEGTTYIGRHGIVRGVPEIRAAYAPRFAPGVARGTLRFEQLEVDLLAPDVANAIAYYVLSQRTAAGADSTIARGPTSLVVRRLGGEWKIVHDHSS
ncbi:hypothetical protein tb265_30140 [Gemmatimonadetes bacterium T265]|nr:hypothetical protein tb265_30140 [Gemmatimonadetes bacterium T265]